MDLALCIEKLMPAANYFGVFENNIKQEYDNLLWLDSRTKPSWKEIQDIQLDIEKDIKKEKLKKLHEERLTEGYLTSFGFKVDCKPEDINNWTSTLQLLETATTLGVNMPTIEIGDFDNITRTLTNMQYRQLCLEIGGFYKNLYSIKWQFRQQIDNCKTIDELEKINITF